MNTPAISNTTSKVCPCCAEQINAAAIVCPRCRQWLSFFSLRSPGLFLVAFLMCYVISGLILVNLLKRLTDPGTDFNLYRNGISIVESRMNLKETGKEPGVYVVGIITNQTDIAWKEVEIETRFYDKSGTLIDTRTTLDYPALLPHDDSAFRVADSPSHPLKDYDSCKVFVRYARDARSRL